MDLPVLAMITAMLTTATPLILGALGELVTERAGVLNLGIEGTMYTGAFVGFLVSGWSGSPWIGLLAAMVAGLLAGLLVGLFAVTLGVNQHVAGIGTTLLLIAACNFTSRQLHGGGSVPQVPKFSQLFPDVPVAGQYLMTYLTFLLVVPAMFVLMRSTGFGLRVRAVGDNPEAADAAGIPVARTRYAALGLGGVLMGAAGAFITLAMLGSFTLNITNGRGWVCIALVIFARWRVLPAVLGGLLFAAVDALQLQLVITPQFAGIPQQLMSALPYLMVIGALVVAGRSLKYPGAYLEPYRRT
jgi:simple sugar transport system permease protein